MEQKPIVGCREEVFFFCAEEHVASLQIEVFLCGCRPVTATFMTELTRDDFHRMHLSDVVCQVLKILNVRIASTRVVCRINI